jgi:hypothetical protein
MKFYANKKRYIVCFPPGTKAASMPNFIDEFKFFQSCPFYTKPLTQCHIHCAWNGCTGCLRSEIRSLIVSFFFSLQYVMKSTCLCLNVEVKKYCKNFQVAAS